MGTVLGQYEITALLGKGGMGEVYRARDSKLKREVAVKILPDEFSRDPERVARFQREAEVLASLNHPNIAAIYDLAEADRSRFLVLELVDGETLADRLKRGPLPAEEALTVAKEISEGLEAAHEKSIIHRDLKPANIKITPDGKVKLLDFGLARVFDARPENSDFSNLPTMMNARTGAGVILGTAAYMSPEQARGKTVDRKTDIWAFACVLYEMLTGKQAFSGETVTDILGAIVRAEPDWTLLPATTPSIVRSLLRRCLQKEPNRRLHDIADVRIELEEAFAEPTSAVLPVAGQSWKRERAVWLVVTGLLFLFGAVFAVLYLRRSPADVLVKRFVVSAEPNTSFASPGGGGLGANGGTLSPDGRRLAFVARDASGKTLLWLRPIDSLAAQPQAGTEDASFPFWSPDSRSLAFFAQGKLKRIDLTGGPLATVCDAPSGRGGTWNRDGTIVATVSNPGALVRVSATGGTPIPVTTLDASRQERSHRWPYFLPDGRHFLYLAQTARDEDVAVFVGSLDSQTSTRLLKYNSNVIYANPGYLLLVRDGALVAQPFNADKLQFTGEPFRVAEQVSWEPLAGGTAFGLAAFSASENGLLSYRTTGSVGVGQLTWFDRNGKEIGSVSSPGIYHDPMLSPDGKRLAVSKQESLEGSDDIWIFDLTTGKSTRFTFDAAIDRFATWSPDGRRIVFASNRDGGVYSLYEKDSSGAGSEELLLKSDRPKTPYTWSVDGRYIFYRDRSVWALPLFGDRKPFEVFSSDNSRGVELSPDGRWLAAAIRNETGRYDLEVYTFPSLGGRWQISTGSWPRWRRDGKELFYAGSNGLTAVDIKAGATLDAGTPHRLFGAEIGGSGGFSSERNTYDVTGDGQRFLVNVRSPGQSTITVVENWAGGLKK